MSAVAVNNRAKPRTGKAARRKKILGIATKVPAPWPGTIWACWDDDVPGRTPEYLLVTERDKLDAPIALLAIPLLWQTIPKETICPPEQSAHYYARQIITAIQIAQAPSRVVGELSITSCPDIIRNDLAGMYCARWGTFDGRVYKWDRAGRKARKVKAACGSRTWATLLSFDSVDQSSYSLPKL